MCKNDWECDCHLLYDCRGCYDERTTDDGEPCPWCSGDRDYDEPEFDEPEFDPAAADRMADRADDARWARMP